MLEELRVPKSWKYSEELEVLEYSEELVEKAVFEEKKDQNTKDTKLPSGISL